MYYYLLVHSLFMMHYNLCISIIIYYPFLDSIFEVIRVHLITWFAYSCKRKGHLLPFLYLQLSVVGEALVNHACISILLNNQFLLYIQLKTLPRIQFEDTVLMKH